MISPPGFLRRTRINSRWQGRFSISIDRDLHLTEESDQRYAFVVRFGAEDDHNSRCLDRGAGADGRASSDVAGPFQNRVMPFVS